MDFEDEEPLERTFNELCDELCLQNSERVEAWEKYRTVWSNYSLDGEPMQWLVCSLFDCVKQRSHAETAGAHLSDISSGMLSLSRLLKLSGVTLMQFFHRMRLWVNMVDMPQDFKSRMMMLERQFSITAICFRKMTVLFPRIFRTDVSDLASAASSGADASTVGKSAPAGKGRQRAAGGGNSASGASGASAAASAAAARQVGSQDLFGLTWTLFLQVKAFYPTIADDLVNCHLLLLVTIDWLYMVCLSDKNSRSDLLNPLFSPRDRSSLSILEDLCDMGHASSVNAKVVQANYFRASLERLFEEKILTGVNNFYLSLDPSDFDHSSLHLNSTYEMFVLSDGDLDERILLSDSAEKEVGAPVRGDCRLLLDDEASRLNPRLQRVLAGAQLRLATEDADIVQQFANPDKLLLQGYKGDYLTPTVQAHGVARLQALLAGRRREFGEATLSKMRQYCSGTAPWDDIRAQVAQLRSGFLSAYDLAVTEADVNRNEMQRRASLSETLFYMALDAVLTCEADKVPDEDQLGVRLSAMLGNRSLLACLFAACAQVVLYSFGCSSSLVWCLDAAGTPAFHLFKIVESLVEAVDFPRDIVRHLRLCVDRVVDSLAWSANSPLWKLVQQNRGRGFSAEECQRPLASAAASAGVSPKMSKGLCALQAFYRHLHRLCDARLSQLTAELHLLNPVAKQRASLIIGRVLRENPGLLRNRHLDHVIACALFASSRAAQPAPPCPLKFSMILAAHRRASHIGGSCSTVGAGGAPTDALFRSVPLDNRGNVGDIIQFYNAVFTTEEGDHIRQVLGCRLLTDEETEAHLIIRSGTSSTLLLTSGIPSSKRIGYNFLTSSDKDVQAINAAILQHATKLLGKRQASSHHIGMELSPLAAKKLNLLSTTTTAR